MVGTSDYYREHMKNPLHCSPLRQVEYAYDNIGSPWGIKQCYFKSVSTLAGLHLINLSWVAQYFDLEYFLKPLGPASVASQII